MVSYSDKNLENAMTCNTTAPVVKIDFFQRKDSQEVMNSLYFESTTAWSEASVGSLMADLWTWWAENVMTVQSEDVQLVAMRATDLSDPEGFSVDYVSPLGPASGTAEAESLPSNVAMVVSFRTGKRGRSNRGRIYLTGLYDAAITQNTWGETYVTLVQGFFEEMGVMVVTDHDAAHVVYSCRDSGGGGGTIGVAVPVTEYLINPVAASQRKRLPGRGQ